MSIVLIYPNSLFHNNPLLEHAKRVTLLEHPVYFSSYNFHKLKLILHRSSMKYYQDYIKSKYTCKVSYIDHKDCNMDSILKQHRTNKIELYDPTDHHVVKELKKLTKKYNIELHIHETPLFLTPLFILKDYHSKTTKNIHNSFYIWQRKRLNILIKKGKPLGGKWSFDAENQKPFPKNPPKSLNPTMKDYSNSNKYITNAKEYINKFFKDSYGSDSYFYIPITHKEAKSHLINFIKTRLKCFGDYQDAVDENIIFGCHSVISPILNIGLITPEFVVSEILKSTKKSTKKLKNIEGFIRQIIGWREYVRMMYMFERKSFNGNHFNHKRKLQDYWFEGTNNTHTLTSSGFQVIDNLINKTVKYGYLHHIERLMYNETLSVQD